MAEKKKTNTKKTTTGTKKSAEQKNRQNESKKTSNNSNNKEAEKSEPKRRSYAVDIAPWLLVLLGIYLIFCFITGDMTGVVGKYTANILYGLFGGGAIAVPLYIINTAIFFKKDYEKGANRAKTYFTLTSLIILSALIHLLVTPEGVESFGSIFAGDNIKALYNSGIKGGGVVGGVICEIFRIAVGYIGAMIICWALTLIIGVFLFGMTPADALKRLAEYFRHKNKERGERRLAYEYEREKERAEQAKAVNTKTAAVPKKEIKNGKYYDDMTGHELLNNRKFKLQDAELEDITSEEEPKREETPSNIAMEEVDTPPWVEELDNIAPPETDEVIKNASGKVLLEDIFKNPKPQSPDIVFAPDIEDESNQTLEVEKETITTEEKIAESDKALPEEDEDEHHKLPYVFPPISLLKQPQQTSVASQGEINKTAEKLVQVLESFGVRTKILNTCCGPTVTRYELQPEQGVRSNSITKLTDDIALHLAATSVRIESPIPGKSAVGIEIPNKTISIVHLRELLDNSLFRASKSNLFTCLGEDIAGNPVYLDIEKMPHLLIAGATGMGKSVCINSLIVSLLYKSSPEEVKLILIDPKMVELNVYNNIPHLLVPVVTDPKKAAGSLSWAVTEMEKRFSMIQEVGARNITEYNEETKYDPEKEHIPRIVIIIDELADLMMTASDDVETSICRLTQKARAAGMHLIIGTQRPSVDVITGLIKANIPSRIAFTVASQIDSRTILDVSGAEKLMGRGDMLYAPVGSIKPLRVQGTFVDAKEVEAVCDYIRQAAIANYDTAVIESIEREAAMCGEKPSKKAALAAAGGDDLFSDNMIFPALEVAVECQTISTSLLQRRLKLGYSRAAKIIDILESKGCISKFDPSIKGRKILVTSEQIVELRLKGADNPASAE